MTTTTEHFHIDASAEGPDCCSDIFAALDSAHFWIDGEADAEHQSISALGEAGDYEGAFRAWQRSETLSVLALNIANVTDHHYERKQPAPLYSGEDAATLLHEAALRLVDEINASDAHVSVYAAPFDAELCETEEDDDDAQH